MLVEIWEVGSSQEAKKIGTEKVNIPPSSIAERPFFDFRIGCKGIVSVEFGAKDSLPRIFVYP